METFTKSKRAAFGLLGQTVLLLLAYAAVSLLAAVKFLPQDPLAQGFTYAQASAFAHMLLNLAIVTGLIGGGIYVVANDRPRQTLDREALLLNAYRGWTVLVILVFFSGLLGLSDGRHLLEQPQILDILQGLLMAMFIVAVYRGGGKNTPFVMIWTAGLSLSVICILIGILPPADFLQERILRTLSVNFNLNVAYLLAALALIFWLMTRFSNIMQMWADEGLYTTAGLLTLAGTLVSLAPLMPLGASNIGVVALLLIFVCCAIFAAHSYRALSDLNPTRTLSAHWVGLAVILIFVGMGFLGSIQALPGIQQWTQGTRLTDLQHTLIAFALVAVVLGAINQIAAELRGHNERVTGLMPFWLVAFGLLFGGIALGLAGVVQTYIERILGVGYLDAQNVIVPLLLIWIIGWWMIALGIGIYALGFRARRPETRNF